MVIKEILQQDLTKIVLIVTWDQENMSYRYLKMCTGLEDGIDGEITPWGRGGCIEEREGWEGHSRDEKIQRMRRRGGQRRQGGGV